MAAKVIPGIEGITGPMMSGKSTELLRRLRRVELAGHRTVLFKPRIDDRYDPELVVTHDGVRREAVLADIDAAGTHRILDRALATSAVVVGIEEAQFHSHTLLHVCRELRAAGRRVIWTGLDMDYRGEPFGVVPALMAVGHVTKLTAVCQVCGAEAAHTYRRSDEGAQVVVGGPGKYEARCFSCWARASALKT